MLKRLISLITVFCLALGVGALAGCGSNTDADNQNNQSGGAAMGDISAEKVVYINESGESVYRIVRPNDKEMTSVAAVVFKQMKDGLGVGIRNVLDSEDGTDLNEILIGNTNRPESAQAIDYLRSQGYGRYNDYIVCTIGKKIVINGMSNEAIEKAADCFVKNFIKKEGIEGGICRLYATEGSFSDITVNGTSISKYNFVWDSTNLSWLIRQEVGLIQDFLRETTGFYVPLKEDAGTDKGEYEISIGNTDRAVKAQSEYSYEEWEILISGKKVNILGGSTYAVQVAVTEFGKMLQKKAITDADSTTGTYSETVADYDSSTYYSLKWCDEFDGDSLDTSKWTLRPDMAGQSDLALCGEENPAVMRIEDGKLKLNAVENADGNEKQYSTCYSVTTFNKMRFRYGYLEISARVPYMQGAWPSFWLKSLKDDICPPPKADYMAEIDVFEVFSNADTAVPNLHKWYPYNVKFENGYETNHTQGGDMLDGSKKQPYVFKDITNLNNEYHTYGFEWTPEYMAMSVDGEVYCTYDINSNYDGFSDMSGFHDALYVLFNNHIFTSNSSWAPGGAEVDERTDFPINYWIDYIRLYQKDEYGDLYLA